VNRALVAVAFLSGCFDSIVSDPCAAGYAMRSGTCVARNVATDVDAGVAVAVDASADAPDPGSMLLGHIVAIGHDYATHDAAMERVLGDAAGLGAPRDLGIVRWLGTAEIATIDATTEALAAGLADVARPWHSVGLPASPDANALAAADVLIVDAQLGDGDAAALAGGRWQVAIDPLLARGGVVIVLEGRDGVSHRFAAAAGLTPAIEPVLVTGQLATIVDGTDGVAAGVPTPYVATASSVAYPGAPHAVIAAPDGSPIVTHATR
jgi:hypothetical protein